jgi:drug/metabolite transporter (DMT)-like permease
LPALRRAPASPVKTLVAKPESPGATATTERRDDPHGPDRSDDLTPRPRRVAVRARATTPTRRPTNSLGLSHARTHAGRFVPMPNPTPPSAERRRAVLMLLLANLFWGLSFPVIKALTLLHARLLPAADTWFSTLYTVAPRFLLAIVIVIAWRPRGFWRVTRGELKQGVILALFAAGGMLLQNDGLQFTAASTSAFLTQFYAILIPVWLSLRHQRNPGARVWTCCALVLAGVAILGHFNWQTLRFGRGEWETLLSSLFFMGQILWLSKREYAANRPEKITLVMFATQAVLFWALAFALAPDAAALRTPWLSPVWLGFTAVLALVCTVAAFFLMNAWQPKISATEAGLIYCIEPIFGSLMACFLPAFFSTWAAIHYANETATWTLLVGGGLITFANILLQLQPPAKE